MKKTHFFPAQLKHETKQREKRWKELHSMMQHHTQQPAQQRVVLSREEQARQAQIFVFLKRIGLQQYFALFKTHCVEDLDTLRDMSDSHLEELGIPEPHRVKILQSVAQEPSTQPANPAASRRTKASTAKTGKPRPRGVQTVKPAPLEDQNSAPPALEICAISVKQRYVPSREITQERPVTTNAVPRPVVPKQDCVDLQGWD